MRIGWFPLVVAAGGLVVWVLAHLALPFLLGAIVVRRWPALARLVPYGHAGQVPRAPFQTATETRMGTATHAVQSFARFQADRDGRALVSPAPDPASMQARYDEAIFAQLEGRELTPAQQRIVQFHYHGEGCRACAAGRPA